MTKWIRRIVSYYYHVQHTGTSGYTNRLVRLYDENGDYHFVNFVPESYLDFPPNGGNLDKPKVSLCLHDMTFPEVIDMLRNESPVFLRWVPGTNDNLNIAQITTAQEPVGEEET